MFLQQLLNGLSLGAIYALIALGYTMVYGTLQLINFAHGEVYMMGAFAALYFAKWTGVAKHPTFGGALVVMVATMAFCAALGILIERVAYRPLRRASRLNMLITALGVSLLLQNVALLAFGALQNFPSLLPTKSWMVAGVGVRSNDVLTLGVTVVLMLGLTWLVERTQVGRAMRAVSHSRESAALMGIPVDRIVMLTFAIGSVLAGAAAVLVANDKHTIRPEMGMTGGMKAFVAAVLGGIGNIPGAVAGGLLLGLAETFVSGYLASTYRDAIAFLLLIAVLLTRPAGLLGTHTVDMV
jgi:branched-chain amino acid transport system permease protein